ncbi:hypothetical protein C9374_004005 [Naegleria lovaniensis]|uniref:V-type proton ATPase subunit H n=1 Tax=Naegleria lovaniensis TaxID=51637 RepID=A0AA88H912_NAELO|nr:uncharacterized protein C9374_004005 [Naegleria lovaniensis]KAG2394241.1 hypothetical protein C9374_004005 [Naegleria lovaniensis]
MSRLMMGNDAAASMNEEFNADDLPEVNWESYQEAGILTPLERQRIESISMKRSDVKSVMDTVRQTGNVEYIQLFIKLLNGVHKNEALINILYLIDLLFENDKAFCVQFHDIDQNGTDNQNNPFTAFLSLFIRNDIFITEKAFNCLSKLFELDADKETRSSLYNTPEDVEMYKQLQQLERQNQRGKAPEYGYRHQSQLESFIEGIASQLKNSGDDVRKARMCVRALMRLLKRNDCRAILNKVKGIPPLINLLRVHRTNVQILYEVSCCLWMLTFHENAVSFFQNEALVPKLHDVLKSAQKEKVIRIILATFKNLLKYSKFVTSMVNVSVPKTLLNLQKRSFEDKDITEELKSLIETLDAHIDEISSFDEYRQEVLSGHLEWTPVHSSEKFWKENMDKMEQNNFYILRELIKLLEDESNADNLAIGCHDIGEFVRYHNRGKRVITDLGAKARIIQLMEHPNEEVKKHALQCCQKIMVKNWEFIK